MTSKTAPLDLNDTLDAEEEIRLGCGIDLDVWRPQWR
jgi:hypothetical protein